jgi:hypothetical protein
MKISLKEYKGKVVSEPEDNLSVIQRIRIKLHMIKNIIIGRGVMYRISITGEGTIKLEGNDTRKYSISECKILDGPEEPQPDPFLEEATHLRDELDRVSTGLHDGSIKMSIVDGRVVMNTRRIE